MSAAMEMQQCDVRDPASSQAKYHFMNLRNMAMECYTSGEMQMLVLAMIAKFERNEGGDFRHPLLTQYTKAEGSVPVMC